MFPTAQSYYVDSQTETLLSDGEMHTAATELFAQPQFSRQNEEVSVAHSQHASIQQSLTGESMLPSNQTPKQIAKSNRASERMESAQKESLTPESESMDGAGVVLKKKADSPAEEEQESLQDAAGGLLYSSQKKRLTRGSDDAGRVEAVVQESPVTPENVQENLTGNSFTKQLSSTPKHLNTAIQISQRISTETPAVSRTNTKELDPNPNPATKEIVERITQRTVKGSEPQEMLDMETEHSVIPEAETDSEEMSDAETDVEKTDPTGKTPAFVHARAFQCTPLLATPHTLKVAVSSVNLYFKHLTDDLEVYTNHARRKTTEPADMELLMRRQGLITDKTPLNVLIERHLPLEYRKLLIPVATSGNKVIPPKLQ
ncbi:hypothetical protein JD844_000278 [Phrynosoma platyrhinos]|uniref:CENP-T/Histone H4 histone fold domain-containing protein n=1 Tax=Phrynosoma platyrhinos TaxID=52577 RepID=A0ABQ7SQG6_PHRPL|nr:hypothetical protein JD844_000278 [Phrynosoma platyrhinos]